MYFLEIVEAPTGWDVVRPRTAVTRVEQVVTVNSPGTTVTRGLTITVSCTIVSSRIFRLNSFRSIIISLIIAVIIHQFDLFIL